jgi:hypothetical protein
MAMEGRQGHLSCKELKLENIRIYATIDATHESASQTSDRWLSKNDRVKFEIDVTSLLGAARIRSTRFTPCHSQTQTYSFQVWNNGMN